MFITVPQIISDVCKSSLEHFRQSKLLPYFVFHLLNSVFYQIIIFFFHIYLHIFSIRNILFKSNRIGCVMVRRARFEFGRSWVRAPIGSNQRLYKIGMCCFSAKHVALRRKSKNWVDRNQDNVCQRGDMSIRRLLFQWASTIYKNPTKRVGLVQSGAHHHIIEN